MKKKLTRAALAAVMTAAAAPVGLATGQLTVNDGQAIDKYVPFHFYYLDDARCRTQVIYPAEQLASMAGSSIREIQFYLDDDGYQTAWATQSMILSLAECDQNGFTTDAGQYAAFYDGTLAEAFNGPMSGDKGGRYLTFKLAAPYAYTGSNLLVQVSLGSAGNAYPSSGFLGVSTTDYFPAAYTTTGSSVYGEGFLPKTTFTYGELAQYEATLSATEAAFPVTMLGQSSTLSVTVTNTGAQALTVSMALPVGPFTATLPATDIPPGGSFEIPVTFTPEAAGAVSATLTLEMGEAGTRTVALNGIGMETPTGLVTDFDVAAATLPEGWTGLVTTGEYDYDIQDYKPAGQRETDEYFTIFTLDGTNASAVNRDNPFREYPNLHTIYMVSPAVSGNVLLKLARDNSGDSYGASTATVYTATQGADGGDWIIGTDPLPFTWAQEPGSGWGVMIGNVPEASRLAVCLSSMAIATFAADTDASGSVTDKYEAAVSPASLDFGQLVTGHTATLAATVTNTGSQPLPVACAADPAGVFTAEAAAAEVAPGQSVEITVTFAPVEAGEFAHTLDIDLGQAGTRQVSLTGKGVAVVTGSEFTADGLTYTVLSETEAGVSGVASDVTACAVPATVANPDGVTLRVVSVEREAFYWSNVKSVTLPDGLRTIGYGAFRSSPLEEINLPATLTSIGDFAFRTTGLRSVEIPDGVTALGSSVFASCEQLASVKLPAALVSIGSGAFYKTALTSVTIPESCATIDAEAFELCASLTSVKLPSSLTEISSMLFLGCGSLASIEIPEGVITIRTRSFEETGLTTLRLPASLAKIESSSFNGTPLAAISVASGNSAFKVTDGALYDADGSFLYLYPRSGAPADYAVAQGTRGIIGGAFYACPVENVSLPESMAGIDEYAFCLSGLKSVNLPAGIFLIGTQAFAGTGLTDVVLPEALEEVSDGLFAACAALRSVTIPAATEGIGNRAFYNCTALAEIIALGDTPAEFDAWEALTDPFLGVDCDKVTVYCPDGESVLSAYKASEWADFFANIRNISDRPSSALDRVDAATAGGTARVYTLDGRLVDAAADAAAPCSTLPAGLYIVRDHTGTRKVAVR